MPGQFARGTVYVKTKETCAWRLQEKSFKEVRRFLLYKPSRGALLLRPVVFKPAASSLVSEGYHGLLSFALSATVLKYDRWNRRWLLGKINSSPSRRW